MKQYKTLRKSLLLLIYPFILVGFKGSPSKTKSSNTKEDHKLYNNWDATYQCVIKKPANKIVNENDDYEQILPVFTTQPIESLLLDKILLKANIINSEKNQQKDLNEAYLLLGKAYFYNRDYFSAMGYLDVVVNDFKDDPEIYSQALTYKLRCLLEIGSNEEAQVLAYTIVQRLDKNYKNTADTYAAIAATYLANNQFNLAISLLESAALKTSNAERWARWTYICAQLQECQADYTRAAANYNKVKQSNASIELKLSATLKEIILAGGARNSLQYNKELIRLLSDPNYVDFKDQIYYQLGKNTDSHQMAEKYYLKALEVTGKNQTIRGLAQSRIADINLYQFNNYLKAKNYYDSAAMSLPKTLIHVTQLERIDNLRTIAKLYHTINAEDSSQKSSESLPSEQKIIDGYYEIATIFQHKLGDEKEAIRIYHLLKNRFPENKYSKYIDHALKNLEPLVKQEPVSTTKVQRKTPTAASSVKAQEASDFRKSTLELPRLETNTSIADQRNYYFIISVNDVKNNLTPSRYRLGEYNRGHQIDDNIRHRLLEVDHAQVIYTGIFGTVADAKDYSNEIAPQLQNIINLPKGEYATTVLSKKNLEKMEKLEMLKQK